MPVFEGDLSGIQSSQFAEIPSADYVVYLHDLKEDKKDAQSSPYWACEFKIPEGDKFGNRSLFVNVSFSEKSLWKAKEFFDAFGVDTSKKPIKVNAADLLGKKIKVRVTQDEYEGEKRPRISKYMRLDGGAPATAAPSSASAAPAASGVKTL